MSSLTALGDGVSSRFRKAATAYLVADASWRFVQRVRIELRNKMTYRVSIASDDDIYPEVHRWLIEQVPAAKVRSFAARTHINWGVSSNASLPVEVGATAPKRRSELTLAYDSSREQIVRIGGHRVVVSLERLGATGPGGTLDDTLTALLSRATRSDAIVFTAYSPAGRDGIVAFLAGLAEERSLRDNAPAFMLADRWGSWERRDDLPRRSLDSIVLRAGQKEELVDDVTQFLNREADYARMGVPYHRGYLLHGPPGTGKTSIAQAIATHFNLDLYYLPLSDLTADASLLRLVGAVRPRSVLLLEDIDVASAATDREDPGAGKGATMNGLLNSLDGVATPHGLITIMTTNHLDKLDDALVRAGRIDRHVHVDLLDAEQLGRLVRTMVGRTATSYPEPDELSPAQVVEAVKRHLGDPDAAIAAITELVGGPRMRRLRSQV